MEDAIEIELLSLSNPQSSKGDGNLCDRTLWSLLLLLCPWPQDDHQGVHLSLGTSCADWFPGGEVLVVLNLKGLLGWQIYSRTSQSSNFHSMVQYSMGYGPFTLL